MGLSPKYIKDTDYAMEDAFTDALHKMSPIVAFKIGRQIESDLQVPKNNQFRSQVFGGVVVHHNISYYYAVELIKEKSLAPILTNIIEITLDDYLDLINLNTYIKLNGTSKEIKRDNIKTFINTRHH